MIAVPTFDYVPSITPGEQSQAAARRRLEVKRRALIEARQSNPNAGVTPAMMTTHYETAESFIRNLDAGKVGTTLEDRAAALAVVLAGAVAGAKAEERELTERVLADFAAGK